MPGRPWSDEELAEALRLRAAKVPQAEIAALLGRSTQGVAQKFSKLDLPRVTTPAEVRFARFVDRRGADECWPWKGAKDRKGYGAFSIGGHRRVTASRFAFKLTNGEIPDGMAVMHLCDNPPCVNPAHLTIGTIADNNRDMVRKGRVGGWGARQIALARS